MKKTDPFNTLDKARDEIQRLERKLAQANEINKPAAANVSPAAVSEKPGLTLLPVTEETLRTAIDAELNWKAKWLLQRSLARLQTARIEAEVRANKRSRR